MNNYIRNEYKVHLQYHIHKNPYKQRYIADSSKCFTKPLSLLLTKLLSDIKESHQRYCSTAYSRSDVYKMWILINLKDLLDNLKSHDFSKIDIMKIYDFSTLYTILPHDKLKSRLFQIIDNCFFEQKLHPTIQISSDWETRYIFCKASF
jgi:hypothetical protein